jgi:hypothetical protein
LTENGESINGMSRRPTMHDMLTGSQADGRAFPGNLNLTCFLGHMSMRCARRA